MGKNVKMNSGGKNKRLKNSHLNFLDGGNNSSHNISDSNNSNNSSHNISDSNSNNSHYSSNSNNSSNNSSKGNCEGSIAQGGLKMLIFSPTIEVKI